jgi:hypothetical protein
MTLRVVVLAVLALGFLAAGLAAVWFGVVGSLNDEGLTSALVEEQEAWARRQAWQSVLFAVPGPFITAGLIAAVGALVLVVRSRQVAGIRTVSAPASTSVRNPMTTPKSSPSSSNSSGRSSRTSNVDAFR